MTETEIPGEEAFRAEVLEFLGAALPLKGSVEVAAPPDDALGSGLQRAVNYQRRLADAGLAGITWPAAYGGRGLPERYQRIFDREARRFQVPPRSLEIGLGMCGPTIVVHGTDEQKRAFIPPLLRGEHIWCELFSEPAAGSDLSSVQTRARRDGDEFVLDGQKVWTSGAQHSDYAACLARSDPSRPKREGITMLIVDMHTPGITVRPLRQMNGESHFSEVFLDGVRVPVANVLGDVDDGWRVARTMLAFERQALSGMGSGGGNRGGFSALVDEANRRDLSSRPWVRDRLVQLRIEQMVLGHLTARLQVEARQARGGSGGRRGNGRSDPGGTASLLKLAMARLVQRSALVGVDVAGIRATAWEDGEPAGGRWCNQLLSSRSASLGGGTDEIVRNVIAERILGLPRDEEGDLMPGDLHRVPGDLHRAPGVGVRHEAEET
jgi:alkylation response protein AidB-like acyl-CoA dehydrogenase